MGIKRSLALGCLGVLLGFGARGQSFEVADVRVNNSNDPVSADFLAGGQIALRGMTMKLLIGIAWKETRLQPELASIAISVSPAVAQFRPTDTLKGGPSWLNSDRFDVIAKATVGTPPDTIRLMLQKLLMDRFHLMVHREEKTTKVWAMTVAKGGHHLREAPGGDPVCVPSIGADNVYHRECHNMPMSLLADELPGFAPRFFDGKPVVDATDLKGTWDFRLDWTPLSGGLAGLQPGVAADQFDTGTTIFRTMEKNLGLKLEQREQGMPIIVIDQVERVPTDN
jgi:uncharacterized protein (TIGR03435 family)